MAFNKNKIFLMLFSILTLSFLYACSYSFTGASVPPHLKTISIPIFPDRSGTGEFDLGEKLTTNIIKKFIDDNTLLVSDKLKSDSVLEGTIVSLTDAATVVSGGETVTTRRLTITVRVLFKDLVKRATIFERNFTNYGDYPAGGDITLVRQQAIEAAIDKIAEDILLGVVSNW